MSVYLLSVRAKKVSFEVWPLIW